jgi:hypothetical protein
MEQFSNNKKKSFQMKNNCEIKLIKSNFVTQYTSFE